MTFTNPGMGIYSKNNDVRLKDIYHQPQIGCTKTDGEWCPICKQKKINIPGLNREKNVRCVMNKSNNDPSKRVYEVSWVKEKDYPIKITKRIEKFNSSILTISKYIPENFIHGSGSYLLETSKYPQYIHEQIWELVKKHRNYEVEKTKLLERNMKVDLRKSTKKLLMELQAYCLETHATLISRGQNMSQFEKGKGFTMMEIGTKLKKIMYKER